ncbi:MAG TPA: hypothetical protein VMW07_04790 [Gallionella sp.]|nr:hypothetical protein [Gallionella sp.]
MSKNLKTRPVYPDERIWNHLRVRKLPLTSSQARMSSGEGGEVTRLAYHATL